MQIRDMMAEDWPAVSMIYQLGMDTKLATFEAKAPTWEHWDTAHQATPRLVCELADSVAGWTALAPVSQRKVYAGVAELTIYVHPHHQGQGVGRILLKAMVERAESQGFWTLQSVIFEENKASISLHQKAGFRVVGIREKIAKVEDKWVNTILMEKRSEKWI